MRSLGRPKSLLTCEQHFAKKQSKTRANAANSANASQIEVFVSIFVRQEWRTGRDLSHLLLVAALLELALVLDLVLQGAVLRQHMIGTMASKSNALS